MPKPVLPSHFLLTSASEPGAIRWQTLRLSPQTARSAADWSASVAQNPYGPAGGPQARHQIWECLPTLPRPLFHAATRFGRSVGHAGLLHITGLPIPDDLPPTPDRPYPTVRHRIGTEALLLGLGDLVGDVISFADWHEGDQVQNLYPLKGEAWQQNASNAVFLEMHTETAFRPNTPDALILFCLRSDPDADTLLCDLLQVWEGLDMETRRALMEPAYAFRAPGGGTTEAKPIAVDWSGRLRFHYAEALLAVADHGHTRALRALQEGIHATTRQITLAAGDLLVIDNVHTVHGRTRYRPRYDGTDRWLQRCLIRASPLREARIRTGPPLPWPSR